MKIIKGFIRDIKGGALYFAGNTGQLKLLPMIAAAVLLAGIMSCSNESSISAADEAVIQSDTLLASVERQIEEKKDQQKRVDIFRRRHLPRNFSEQIKKYLPGIKKYSKWYGLDWRLIIAVILKESYFKENARSHVGAMGLMQIMPGTAWEIKRELDIEYISKDPRENITAGIYHMYKQLKYFPNADPENRLKLALAAYNAGPARVFDAQVIARYKELDPYTWEAVRECLPLLTNDNWRLHLDVWEQGVPAHGFFYGFDQTIDYVDDISKKYILIKHLFKVDFEELANIDFDPAMQLSSRN